MGVHIKSNEVPASRVWSYEWWIAHGKYDENLNFYSFKFHSLVPWMLTLRMWLFGFPPSNLYLCTTRAGKMEVVLLRCRCRAQERKIANLYSADATVGEWNRGWVILNKILPFVGVWLNHHHRIHSCVQELQAPEGSWRPHCSLRDSCQTPVRETAY